MRCSSLAHHLQKRQCPHGYSASAALGSVRHTSQTAGSAVAAGGAAASDGADADDVEVVEIVAVCALSTSYVSVSSSLLLTSSSYAVRRLSTMQWRIQLRADRAAAPPPH